MTTAALGLGLVLVPPTLPAQVASWGVTIEAGGTHVSGHSRSTGGSIESSAHPDGSGTWGLQVDRQGRRVGFALGVLVASPGVTFESDEAAVVAKGLLSLVEIAPEVSIALLRPHESILRVHAGAVIDRWDPKGDASRTALGLLGALSLEVPFSSRLSVRMRYEAAVTGSVFDEDDLPPDFERRSGVRRRWAIGARLGL